MSDTGPAPASAKTDECPIANSTMPEIERRILEIATDAFDDEAKARRWLREPNIQMGNQPPIDVIGTPEGFHIVELVLNQIKYAIFA